MKSFTNHIVRLQKRHFFSDLKFPYIIITLLSDVPVGEFTAPSNPVKELKISLLGAGFKTTPSLKSRR